MQHAAPQNRCALCDAPINRKNDSREHVIPNSIGGRLKTKGFVCVDCNSRVGEKWDAELARQLNALSLFFGITRHRGEPPAEPVETTAGEKFMLQPGGGLKPTKPSVSETATEAGIQISISARNSREARRILQGLRRKYPGIDADALLKGASPGYSYPEGLVHLSLVLGGELAGRSIVKTAVAIAHCGGIRSETCDIAMRYLREPSATACFGYYYDQDLVTGRPPGTPLHCAAVSADPETGMLLGYLEYFGTRRMVVSLSTSYGGPRVDHVYGLDPLSGKQLPLKVALPFTVADLEAIYDYRCIPDGALESVFSEVLPTGLARQFEREKQRVITDAVDYALKNCGVREGEVITVEHAAKLASLMTERLRPFLLHQIRRPARPPRK